jgi:serine protease AprX
MVEEDSRRQERLKNATIVFIVVVILILGLLVIIPYVNRPPEPEDSQWAYEELQIEKLHDLGFSGKNVTIGIIDTGIDLTHPELEGVNVTAWRDFINDKSKPYDDNKTYHGTSVAGIIVGKTLGIAPNATLIVAKVFPEDGQASVDDLTDAIQFCIDNGADIISMSLGARELRISDLINPWSESDIEKACKAATDKGIFLVIAAGNDHEPLDDGEVSVPGVFDKAITVGAVDYTLKIADFSSEGDNDGNLPNLITDWDPWERKDPDKKPEVVAPGVNIDVPGPNQGYRKVSGTSISTPFVTGALALILGELEEFQHENNGSKDKINEVKEAIKDTSKELPKQDTPHDDRYGYGLLQAYYLYLELKQ